LAVRALIIREFDDLDRSVLRTKPLSIRNLDVSTGLAQLDDHAILRPQFGEVGVTRFFRAQLVHRLDDVDSRRLVSFVGLYALVVEAELILRRFGVVDRNMTLV